MKRIVLTLACLFSALQAPAAEPVPAYPPHTVPNTLVRDLPTNADGRSYQLHIHLPASFGKDPKRRYPVLYVTDGYWDFSTVVSSYSNLNYDRVVPEFITVGLGYAGKNLDHGALRVWELSPRPLGPNEPGAGHADQFLASLEKDIFPLVEREYRADPAQRYLAGSSLGGLFALHAMYARPGLFQGYIAASPAVVVGGDWIIGQAKAFAATGKPIKARLYVTGAEYEWPGFLAGIKRYQALLPELKHPGLVWENRTIDGERHAGTKAESYTRGMRFLFEPLAPEHGPSKD